MSARSEAALRTEGAGAPLRAAGLTDAGVEAWLAAVPQATGVFSEDCRTFGVFWRLSDELIARLPGKPRRAHVHVQAADMIHRQAREARERFLRRHAEAVYAGATHDFSRFVRAHSSQYSTDIRREGYAGDRGCKILLRCGGNQTGKIDDDDLSTRPEVAFAPIHGARLSVPAENRAHPSRAAEGRKPRPNMDSVECRVSTRPSSCASSPSFSARRGAVGVDGLRCCDYARERMVARMA